MLKGRRPVRHIKMDLTECVCGGGGGGQDSSSSGWRPVADSCERGNEPSDSMVGNLVLKSALKLGEPGRRS
jgi:hypothetical protein